MNKTVRVCWTSVYDVKRDDYYDIDVEDYKTWLGDEPANDDNLRQYIEEEFSAPDDTDEDYDEVEDIIEADDLFDVVD